MSISTYNELQTSVKGFLSRDSVAFSGADYVPDLIMLGEKWIFRHARTRDMETALSVTMSSGVAALPADYVALKHARLTTTPTTPLAPVSPSWLYARFPLRSADEKPLYIAVDGSNFVFGPYPDSNYTLDGIYYARLTSIASSANALFTANPDLYLFAALAESEAFMKNDARVGLWMAKRDQILADVNGEDKVGSYSGPLTMRFG